jgi:hypothetical protein
MRGGVRLLRCHVALASHSRISGASRQQTRCMLAQILAPPSRRPRHNSSTTSRAFTIHSLCDSATVSLLSLAAHPT